MDDNLRFYIESAVSGNDATLCEYLSKKFGRAVTISEIKGLKQEFRAALDRAAEDYKGER
jgi:hypothetical protein